MKGFAVLPRRAPDPVDLASARIAPAAARETAAEGSSHHRRHRGRWRTTTTCRAVGRRRWNPDCYSRGCGWYERRERCALLAELGAYN